jgi:hypothetical protein
MVTEDELLLMTAGVDGELTPAQARELRELLVRCPEARVLYNQLRADSDRIRSLPVLQAPPGLTQRVLDQIHAHTPNLIRVKHTSLPTETDRQHRATRSRWIPFGIAACLLLGVTASSFWFFSSDHESNVASGPRVNRGWNGHLPADDVRPPTQPFEGNEFASDQNPPTQTHPAAPQPRPATGLARALAPQPRPMRPEFHAFLAGAEIAPFEFVEVRIPVLQPLSEFTREDVQRDFLHELSLEPAYRIDLFARDNFRGLQFFEAAAQSIGLRVLIDTATADLTRKQLARAVVVYSDALEPNEIVRLLEVLSNRDAKVSPRIFDLVHATPATSVEQKMLTEILGFDPGLFKRPSTLEKSRDTTKPLSSQTVEHLVKSVTTVAGNPAEKTAIALLSTPMSSRTPPAYSAELKQFMANRGLRQSKAVPVLFVIRQGPG